MYGDYEKCLRCLPRLSAFVVYNLKGEGFEDLIRNNSISVHNKLADIGGKLDDDLLAFNLL